MAERRVEEMKKLTPGVPFLFNSVHFLATSMATDSEDKTTMHRKVTCSALVTRSICTALAYVKVSVPSRLIPWPQAPNPVPMIQSKMNVFQALDVLDGRPIPVPFEVTCDECNHTAPLRQVVKTMAENCCV